VKSEVFRPHLPPPTMTLEEFADIEVAAAMERDRKERENPCTAPRSLRQVEGDGDEDNLDMVDQVQHLPSVLFMNV
jgi:hypothetical protein